MTVVNDMNKLMLDVYLSDEESAGEVLLSAAEAFAEEGEPEYLETLAAECTKRGIDPAKALGAAMEKRNKLLKYFNSSEPIPVASKGFSIPIRTRTWPRSGKKYAGRPRGASSSRDKT